MQERYGAMRPSGQPLRAPDTNPEVKNLFKIAFNNAIKT